MRWTYEKGLHELGNGAYAWLAPDGSLGWSNAGLIVDGEESLLVDTLFDLCLTQEMLDAMRDAEPRAASRIGTLVNTHANGDHCHGNQLVEGAEIIASLAAAEEMAELPPEAMAGLMKAMADDPSPLGQFFRRCFGPFEFEGIRHTPPTRTFEGAMSISVGSKTVELIQVGPVPGHGPITDKRGAAAVRGYLEYIRDEARKRYDAGMDAFEAAKDVALGDYASWGDAERIAVNVDRLYREFSGDDSAPEVATLFSQMAELARR